MRLKEFLKKVSAPGMLAAGCIGTVYDNGGSQ